jgi:choline dehydrogenase
LTGSGPLPSNVGEAAAFIRSTDYHFHQSVHPPVDHTSGGVGPDLELVGAPVSFLHHGEEKVIDGSSVFTIVPVNLRPQSHGTVTLQSRDVFDARKFLLTAWK